MRAVAPSFAALAAIAVAPLAAGALALRPGWREGFSERLGAAAAVPGAVWVHAASVGEARAALPLVDELLARGHTVSFSTQTLAGRELARTARPAVPCQLAPLDHPWCVERALTRRRPSALVLVESELWPCWIAAADRRGIPVLLVSGRVSERSFARYRRFRPLIRRTLQRLQLVGARTPEDAERFRALGAAAASLRVTGDLKLDGDRQPAPLADDLAAALGRYPLFVAGSTHAGEERAALAALDAAERAGVAVALVIAPRQLGRVDSLEATIQASGRQVRRRSRLGDTPLRCGEILLLDSMGELAALYGHASAAFVGGSLAPLGGHNVLEPVAAGTPVLFGPHTRDIEHVVRILEACGAGRRVADAHELGRALVEWLLDPEAARARGARGRGELARHAGSARRAAALVEAFAAADAAGGSA